MCIPQVEITIMKDLVEQVKAFVKANKLYVAGGVVLVVALLVLL